MIKPFAFLLGVCLVANSSYSNVEHDIEKITYGPEFTFAGPDGNPLDDNEKTRIRSAYFNALNKHLIDGQTEGAKFKFNTPDKYTSPNGWFFEVEKDPGVIEINMSPLTVADSERYAADINDAIFVTAANKNLVPALFMGGGHLNIGIEQLLKHPMLLRNFLMDMLNNDFLFQGIFGYNLQNAIPTSFFDQESQEDIVQAFKRFDEEEELDGEYLLLQLRQAFYRASDYYPNRGQRSKYSALALSHTNSVNGTARIELRAFRPQTDYYVWLKQIKLIQNRLKYLSQFDEPIKFNPVLPYMKDNEHPVDQMKAVMDPLNDPQEILKAFYVYLETTGEAWSDHRTYIWPKWIMNYETGISELENFEKSDWFLSRESDREESRKAQEPSRCSDLLKGA